jgi:hypothetical protein
MYKRKSVRLYQKFDLSENCTFEEFLNAYKSSWALNSQLFWLNGGKNSKLSFDFIGRFENLENDFKIIANELKLDSSKLPQKLVSVISDSYIDAYTPKLKDLVAKNYKEEIKLFNYEFEN